MSRCHFWGGLIMNLCGGFSSLQEGSPPPLFLNVVDLELYVQVTLPYFCYFCMHSNSACLTDEIMNIKQRTRGWQVYGSQFIVVYIFSVQLAFVHPHRPGPRFILSSDAVLQHFNAFHCSLKHLLFCTH